MKDEAEDAEVMPYTEVVDALAKALKIPNKTVLAVLSGLTSLAVTELRKGKQLQIKDLGRLAIRVSGADAKKRGAPAKRAVLIANKKFKADLGI